LLSNIRSGRYRNPLPPGLAEPPQLTDRRRCFAPVETPFSLSAIKKSGLSYNFRVHHLPGKDPKGYCNTDGQGSVQAISNIHK